MTAPDPPSTGVAPQLDPLALMIRFPDVTPDRLWEFAWSASEIPRWFGSTRPGPQSGSQVRLGTGLGAVRTGRLHVLACGTGGTRRAVSLALDPRSSGRPSTKVTISVSHFGERGAALRIEESGFTSPEARATALSAWREASTQLREDVRTAAARDHNPRQAVVVFHGMGNQRPGETLQALAHSGIFTPGAGSSAQDVWIKPDRITADFELHVCSFEATAGQDQPRTDVYEAYWAPEVSGTSTSQVTAWVIAMLTRFRGVPAPLRASLWLLRVLVLTVAAGMVLVQTGRWQLPAVFSSAVVGLIGVTLLGVAKSWYAGVLGDVARYLRPVPDNIHTRTRMRQKGIDLLNGLHDDGRYDRIVVVAHSLGSVVAYDVLTHLWVQRHREHDRPNRPAFRDIRASEREAAAGPGAAPVDRDAGRVQAVQNRAWRRMRRNTQPWLITDFVTIGSPLAHAPLLLRDSDEQFRLAIADRVLPACPPVLETEERSQHRRFSYERPYRTQTGHPKTFTMLHHAAVFAVTRWSNLYFTSRALGLKGDPIGGPVAPIFGSWVNDIGLSTDRLLIAAHTGYWVRGITPNDVHLDRLRSALHLDVGGQLAQVRRGMPLRLPDSATGT